MSVTELDERTISDAVEVLRYGYGAARGRSRAVRTYAAGRVEYDLTAREVYSYGRHFPLVRYVPRALNGACDTWLVNADIWRNGGGPSRTGNHQAATRRAVERTGARVILLPFSALNGAGIELDSIRPLEVEPDRNETVEHTARTLAELPRAMRRVSYPFTHVRATRDRLPAAGRETWRDATDAEREHEPATATYGYRRRETLPGADGLYRYVETRYRDRAPDSDGLYRWTTHAHILGESTFSAIRPQTETRAAYPMETELETARTIVELVDTDGRRWCTSAPDTDGAARHVAGPGAACVYCSSALTARETRRVRARYLSSFDTNETPALYFLAALPRGAATDVAGAIESLAPAAVHAARARGREVARQGDIFFIDTDLTRDELAARGATFARRTLWTRQAAPRPGEVTYVAPLPAAERRRRAVLERRYARRLWRQRWREYVEPTAAGYGPETAKNGARQATRARALAAREVETARQKLRRDTLAGPEWSRAGYQPAPDARRAAHIAMLERARSALAHAIERERAGRLTRASGARDAYRSRYGSNAAALWRQCLDTAARKYRPAEYGDTQTFRARRDRVRAAVAIYGTAHAATESARIGTAVYVCGTVTHEPDLEPGRTGGRDHRPLILTAGRWYLAVRNAVPRQTRRRRRRPSAPVARQG